MPIKTTRDKGQNLTIHVVTGSYSEEEMYRVLENFYGQKTTALELWDMSQAELAHVTPSMLQKFIRRAAELGMSRRGGQTAVVAPDDLQYGLGRMSETLSELESTPFSFRVFRSRKDALLWLKSGNSS
ncbi:hypothetical protein D1AOALGA4SA_1489 [Olavius algarvensis Delta 1 endosymbiont]|nr:hypothetical protein D1AOALGA4SA_1489 [Olavius algarvensis Delta 1 endosymbiont]